MKSNHPHEKSRKSETLKILRLGQNLNYLRAKSKGFLGSRHYDITTAQQIMNDPLHLLSANTHPLIIGHSPLSPTAQK
jgi:hypothetical protein